jgi:tripeptidyl-peptidase II
MRREGQRPPRSLRALAVTGIVVLGGCASPAAPPAAVPVPVETRDSLRLDDSARVPLAPPAEAAARGWMPLESTGVPAFRKVHPGYDGRGVLIAILDSGIDPGVPGLDRTSTGGPKLVDVRDFSGEGRVSLNEVQLEGDSLLAAGRWLLGAGRLRGLSMNGPFYAGALAELPLGKPPAADVNGNGRVGDTLALLVTRASDGWVVFADTDGDRTLADERPVRDYRVARETFGWATGNRAAPITMAVNLTDGAAGAPPVLDLVFDNSGHGTHVAGIAAGHDLYRVGGFDGVAPGAELLGLKIANDAKGGISVTGSMLEAAAYAIRVARDRRTPLVMNLSFGVGNEAEGAARIDHLLDSLLAANPDVVMTVSAGNDGPGLSTLGFPGSARRPITAGASYPAVFLPPNPRGAASPDLTAFFSSRGGQLAKPDLVTPGLAYSTVPPWDTGEEVKEGTSMAAPHLAGLAASLVSGLVAEKRPITALAVRRALIGSATPLPGGTVLDQGAGQPDLLRAWTLLQENVASAMKVELENEPGDAAWIVADSGSAAQVERTFLLSGATGRYRLNADVPWAEAPPFAEIASNGKVTVRYHMDRLPPFGSFVGSVSGWGADTATGPAFRLPAVVVRPRPARTDSVSVALAPGGVERIFVRADSGRSLRIEMEDRAAVPFLMFLHEPGGMPFRGQRVTVVGADQLVGTMEVDGRDAVAGLYEVVAVGGPIRPARATLRLDPSPLVASATRAKDSVRVELRNVSRSQFDGRVALELAGAERGITAAATGSQQLRFPFQVPDWVSRLVVELTLDPKQWPSFTDFGLTLEDASGRQVATSPMNYAVGRLEYPADSLSSRDLVVVLDPGFAEPGARDRWSGRIAIRFYAANPTMLGLAGGMALHLPPGNLQAFAVPLPPVPWALPSGFDPLGRIVVVQGDRSWRTEVALTPPLPPIMR